MIDVEILGVMPEYIRSQSEFDREPAFVSTNNNRWHFVIEPLSKMPARCMEAEIGYFFLFEDEMPTVLGIEPFIDDPELSLAERKVKAQEYFADKLVVIKPVISSYKRPNSKLAGNVSDVRIIGKPEGFDPLKQYLSVPVYSPSVNNTFTSYTNLVERLLNQRPIGPVNGIAKEPNDIPPFILWKETDTVYKVLGPFKDYKYSISGYTLFVDGLKSVELEKDELDEIIAIYDNPTLCFMSQEFCDVLLKRLEANRSLTLEDLSNNEQVEEQEFVVPVELSRQEESDDTQNDFVKRLMDYTLEQGFLYDPKDLINFHTAMLSSKLVILAGMSGTGKSRLVRLYGEALGLSAKQIMMIPVRPSWTDDADLLGYVDSIHMVFRPGDSGLIDVLRIAENSNKLYIVCFDEMNLARVEHYFSQFLSVLEMKDSERYLNLYNKEMDSRLYNSTQYAPRIKIGNNVLFVGTVNLDESTFHFSDKVLDRANVISLNVSSFKNLQGLKEDTGDVNFEEVEADEFAAWKKDYGMPESELSFFVDLFKCLQDSNKSLGFGPRVVKQIFTYLDNLPELPDLPEESRLSRSEAFDMQVVQRILTKLRGSEEQIKPVLGVWTAQEEPIIEGGCVYEVLDRYAQVSDFTKTREVLQQKAKELRLYGYTL